MGKPARNSVSDSAENTPLWIQMGSYPRALPGLVPVTWSCGVLSATRCWEPQQLMAEGDRLRAGPPGPGLRDVN